MIQRKQSVYLLLAVVALALMYFMPLLDFAHGGQQHATMYACTKSLAGNTPYDNVHWGICSIGGVSILIGLAAIFLYKNRMRQITVVNVFLLSILLLFVTIFAYAWVFAEATHWSIGPTWGIALPPVAYLFGWLARRGIRQDEELVRSAERFR